MVTEEIKKYVRKYVRKHVPKQGWVFFRALKKYHGKIAAVITADEAAALYEGMTLQGKSASRSFPHPVHFREGLIIRNLLRQSGLCADWDDHDLDNHWAEIIAQILEEEDS